MHKIIGCMVISAILSACGTTTPNIVEQANSGVLIGPGATTQSVAIGQSGLRLFTGQEKPDTKFTVPIGMKRGDYYLDASGANLYRFDGQATLLFTKLTRPYIEGARQPQVFYSSQSPLNTKFITPASAQAGDYQLDLNSGAYFYYNGNQYLQLTNLNTGNSQNAVMYSAPWINIYEQSSISVTGGRTYIYNQNVASCILRVTIFDAGITKDVLDAGAILVYGAKTDGTVAQFNYTNYNYGTASPAQPGDSMGNFPAGSGQGGFYNADIGALHLYYFNPAFSTDCQTLAKITDYPKVRYVLITGGTTASEPSSGALKVNVGY